MPIRYLALVAAAGGLVAIIRIGVETRASERPACVERPGKLDILCTPALAN